MALIEMNFMSECLMRTVTVNAIIPFDKIAMAGQAKKERKPFKTLYLLHGIFGNYTDWVCGTRIKRWAEAKDLAVIMPAGENHFYVDCKANGERYSEFIGRELPEKMRQLFPLSDKREDTFIGGLSMGGYGAMINGLKYSDTFGYIAGLSSALILEDMANSGTDLASAVFGKGYVPTVFGDNLIGSENDYYALAEKFAGTDKKKPQIYMCCGVDDSLLKKNQKYAAFLKEKGFPVTYVEGPGNHEWDFWDRYIKKVIDWLPLDEKTEGINSGNIG